MLKDIYKLSFLLLLFSFTNTVQGQSSLTLDASQVFSNFKFVDSEGTQDKSYLGNYSGAYKVGFRHITEGGFLIRVGFGMRKAGATKIYDDVNNIWNLQYIDGKLGIGYMLNIGRMKPYFSAAGYYAYLVKANQTQGSVNYDLIKAKELQRADYGVFITPGLQVELSEYISAYTEFNYMMGLKNIENKESGQKGYNRAYALTLGLAFTITK